MPAGVHSVLSAARQINAASPAADAEISETVPEGKSWQLLAISVSLVQGLLQTPQPILVLDDGADVIFESFGSSQAQASSTTCRYTWAPGLTLSAQVGSGSNVHATAPLPDGLILHSGFRVRTSTLGRGANTDYGTPSLYVVEFG